MCSMCAGCNRSYAKITIIVFFFINFYAKHFSHLLFYVRVNTCIYLDANRDYNYNYKSLTCKEDCLLWLHWYFLTNEHRATRWAGRTLQDLFESMSARSMPHRNHFTNITSEDYGRSRVMQLKYSILYHFQFYDFSPLYFSVFFCAIF